MDDFQKKLERLVAISEIKEQLYRWSRGTARKDWDLIRSVFHNDAQDDHGTLDGSLDQFIEWQKKHHSGVDQSVHFIGNVLVDFVDPDHALSESYVIAFHHYTSVQSRADIVGAEVAAKLKEMTSVIVGRYLDKFERREGFWRILHRQAVFETVKTEEAGRNLLPHWVVSQRDATDPLYRIRSEIGLGPLFK
jgi:SnoaL-like domain